ncbi:anthranilate synthase component I family protein [Streptomyces sp. NBC_00249]|uniref:anthranilate synthase component I family protein n=1 Tax=Streptomyces sp. NBC_00249 TaxID=2975690 RepID=UPI00224F1F0D|nr:anthranilate synthase component I family protein [Streptomyces sp. NBC_00249]MCX5193860.1 anthranilate synthase component I family protein [Streptomyces sp. NBC_00249]
MTTLLDTTTRAPADHGRSPLPVRVEETVLDPHPPMELYEALRARFGEDVFLLESLESPEFDGNSAVVGFGRLAELRIFPGRISAVGVPPVLAELSRVADGLGLVTGPGGDRLFERPEQVWDVLRAVQASFDVDSTRPEYAFGFLATIGYGAAWYMEELPERAVGADGGPDLVLTLFQDTVWYDLDAGTAVRLAARSEAFGPDGGPAARTDLAGIVERLTAGMAEPAGRTPKAPAPSAVRDSTDESAFLAHVERCLGHIGVGDIYQIQIGHRIEVDSALTPSDVYRRLRARNPSPYMYLVPRCGSTLIGASPEVLFRTEGDRIVMRPIAGTTPRSGDPEVDGPRIEALLASEKEQAEHVMLVDLCRNDIGRVCLPTTLDAREVMTVETFSHVFHLVSTVEGLLAPGEDTWSALKATFPAGTVTGAPKIRAMEIISELESDSRGMYAGAVGLVDVRGWSRLALCIRTVTHDGSTYSTQSCAGIVADSSPAAEWRETLHKMGAAYWALTGEELLP